MFLILQLLLQVQATAVSRLAGDALEIKLKGPSLVGFPGAAMFYTGQGARTQGHIFSGATPSPFIKGNCREFSFNKVGQLRMPGPE